MAFLQKNPHLHVHVLVKSASFRGSALPSSTSYGALGQAIIEELHQPAPTAGFALCIIVLYYIEQPLVTC